MANEPTGVTVFNITRSISVAALGTTLLSASLVPANALQTQGIAAAASAPAKHVVSAYTDDSQGVGAQEASILSPGEVRHIRWCAAHYRLAYDPVNDTYARGSMNFPCLSPR